MAYLVKKIEQAHVVWFKASNQWVILDEPKWFVFRLYEKEANKQEAIKEFCSRYSLTVKEGKKTIENIYSSIGKLLKPGFSLPDLSDNTGKASFYKLPKKKTRKYFYRGKFFTIIYGSPYLEGYIHLPLAHLESDCTEERIFSIEVFPFSGRYILRINGIGGRCISVEEPGQLKHQVYIKLVNQIYNKQDNDWLTFIHASAVKKDDEALLLTSTGGSGKSTMAGLLQLNGFDFLTDDFVPISAKETKAYPFPAALCVKNDAVNLMHSKGMKTHTVKNKKTAYVKPSGEHAQIAPCEVKKVVFIKYNPRVDFSFHAVSSLDALFAFHREAWIGDDMKRAEIFLEWFEKLKFYRLEYGNTDKAIVSLTKLICQK